MTYEHISEGRLVIRLMTPEDITAVLEIDRRISGIERAVTYDDSRTGDVGGELDLSFVAEAGDKFVGFILARHAYVGEPAVETGFIQNVGVDPAYRRQGIATRLIISLIEHCKSKGLKTVRIMVNERDGQLQDLFHRFDFRRGEFIDYTRTI